MCPDIIPLSVHRGENYRATTICFLSVTCPDIIPLSVHRGEKLPSPHYLWLFRMCPDLIPLTICSLWRKTTKLLFCVVSPHVSRPHPTSPDYLFTVEKITEFKGGRSVSLSCPVSVVSAHYLLFSVKCPDLIPLLFLSVKCPDVIPLSVFFLLFC